jgi:nanoRNase/pAp phosphatase (c-di-AMP/oligoRNAs hydrolase)
MATEATAAGLEALIALMERRSSSGRWLVLTHDNPDPDSIAAAATLSRLLRQRFKHRVTTAYGGIIGRAENREMVRVLGIRLSHVRHLNWKHYRNFALVDTQPTTGNNQLPDGLTPSIVFDHHPVRRATRSVPFVDVRTEYGATATIVAEYVLASGMEINRREATALVYAIRSETQDFGREYSPADRSMFDLLYPRCDTRALALIQAPRLPLSYFSNLHEALENVATVSTLVVSHLGDVEQPDIVPEIADLLLRLEGKTWSLCTGVHGDRIYLSIRTTNQRADAGRLMRRLLGRRGKGGGHGMMAGGWVGLPSRGEARDLQNALTVRLAKALKKNPQRIARIELAPARESAE